MTEFRLHIDELVLHGFDPRQRHAIADAVQAELARLLADSLSEPDAPAALDGDTSHARVDGGSFNVAPGALPATTGAGLAAALHTAIQRLVPPASPGVERRDG
jgi:hypothetical protein